MEKKDLEKKDVNPTTIAIIIGALFLAILTFDYLSGDFSTSSKSEGMISMLTKKRDLILTIGCTNPNHSYHEVGPFVFYSNCQGFDKWIELIDASGNPHKASWNDALNGAGKLIDEFAKNKK